MTNASIDASTDIDRYSARVRAPFATLGIVTDDRALLGLRFLPATVPAKAPTPNTIAHLVCVQLSAYLDDARARFELPLRLTGSKHQLDVWNAMRAIPAGRTRTYGDVATEIGSNARAVGSACGANPIPLIVPCHRIVAAGGIGGFMGGTGESTLAIKRWLLRHEGAWPESQGALFDE